MFSNYRIIDTKDEPITTISTGIYLINTHKASYLDIKNPKNPINVIATITIPEYNYERITGDIAEYEKLSNLYRSKLDGIIFKIFYRGPQQSQLEKNINKKPVEILPDPNLKNKVEIVTNNINLYQLINYRGPVGILIKIPIFQTY
jgi:hypothetical protein